MFQELEAHLHSEINTLGYPKAALFGFCVALVAYNVLAVIKRALRTQQGEETIEKELSGYSLAGNIARTYDGMMIALPDKEWVVFQTMSLVKLIETDTTPACGKCEFIKIQEVGSWFKETDGSAQ